MKKILFVVFCCATFLSTSQAQVVINEICAANGDVKYDPTYYNFSPWIELYNAGASTVNLNGYYITDDPAMPNKFRISNISIAAKSHLILWCDDMNTNVHTNFSLDSDGESIELRNASAQVVDAMEFPKQYTNVSYGRISNGNTMGYLVMPTPGAQNGAASGTQALAKPNLSVEAGRYTSSLNISVTHAVQDVVLRYTTDGSEPNASSTMYSGSVLISSTKTLKVKAFKDGSLPSQSVAATYFINEHTFTLPVISISTSDAYLNSDLIGIYVSGTNGIEGNCDGARNWNQDWDRHAVIEYFESTGNKKFDQHIDIRLGGACSRKFPQKSLVVKARDKYGSKVIEQKLFPNKDINSYGGFILRNSGNDFNVTMFRDAVQHAMVADQMDIDYLEYQPTILYLNGKYWGIQNMREKIDADYLESNYNVDKDDIDLLEMNANPLEGTRDKYDAYLSGLENMDRSTPEAYDFMNENIAVQEFINYMVTEIYYANTDWPGNNIKYWRQRSTNGKFRWILWDIDFGFALYDWNNATHPTLNFATDPAGPGWPNPPWSTLHLRLALENPKFREQFIKTFNVALNTTFAPERVIGFLNTFRARIAPEMNYHKTRWGGNVNDFNFEVQRMREFATARNAYMRQHLRDFFGLPNESVSVSISTVPEGSGEFKFNGITADEDLVDGAFQKGMSYSIEPVSANGYKFKSWKIKTRESTGIPLIDRGAVWKYYDQGGSPGASWSTLGFSDGAWSSGAAQLGYGEGDEQTNVSYGPDANNKFITTYFRKSFNVTDTVGFEEIVGEALFDDGVVVYLNGIEVFRNNMPLGAVDQNTVALGNIPVENSFYPFVIEKGIVRPGSNVLAVEVHQNGVTSSDISFDLSISTVKLGAENESTTTTPLVTGEAFSDLILEATFEIDERIIKDVVINEISASPSSFKDNHNEAEDWFEIRNNGSKTVNLAGLYLSDNPSTKKKHLIVAETGDQMTLAPGAYKIFWADEEVTEGKDHVRFKLSTEGEMVGLYQELDGEILTIDEVYFQEVAGIGSWSRIPDATGPLKFTSMITPSAENQLIVTGIEPAPEFEIYPNPASETLFIRSESTIDRLLLVDALGHTVSTYQQIRGNFAMPVSDVARGLYLLRIYARGHWQTIRVVKE